MKKTIILLLLFLGLGFGAFKYLQSGGQTKGTVEGDFEKIFAIDDVDKVHKIFLADREGNNTTLTRNGKDWLYDGKYKVRPSTIENLLDVMTRIRVKFRPAASATDFLVKNLSTGGIKMEAYDKAGKKMKAYYIGGSSQDESSSTVILEDSDEPLVAHIPNWTGVLYNRFSLKGDEWKHRAIFEDEQEDIQAVTIDYPDPDLSANSFVMTRESGDNFSVRPLYPTTKVIEKPVVKGKVEAFLVQFESKIAEAFENEHKERETLVKQLPFCVITMVKKDGKEKRVKLFPIYPDDTTVGKEGSSLVVTNRPVFRYYAEVNGEDFMLIQHRVFGEMFWGYNLFF